MPDTRHALKPLMYVEWGAGAYRVLGASLNDTDVSYHETDTPIPHYPRCCIGGCAVPALVHGADDVTVMES